MLPIGVETNPRLTFGGLRPCSQVHDACLKQKQTKRSLVSDGCSLHRVRTRPEGTETASVPSDVWTYGFACPVSVLDRIPVAKTTARRLKEGSKQRQVAGDGHRSSGRRVIETERMLQRE
jgi:hypothetical protein